MPNDRQLIAILTQEVRLLREELRIYMSANDDALAALVTATQANTTATTAVVEEIANLEASGGSDDISAGVLAQVDQINANTDALNAAETPAPPTDTQTVVPTDVASASSVLGDDTVVDGPNPPPPAPGS